MSAQLFKACIASINIEIKAFDKEISTLKTRLYETKTVIESFYSNDYDEKTGAEVKKTLINNKNTITRLKKEADTYAKFEKLFLYLNDNIEFNFNEALILTEELMAYFEEKEAYENCALFQKLQSNLQNKD